MPKRPRFTKKKRNNTVDEFLKGLRTQRQSKNLHAGERIEIREVERVGPNYYKTESVMYSMKFGSIIIKAYDNRRNE
jgi:hypothetical protein